MLTNGYEKYTYRLDDGTMRTVENIPTKEVNKLRREHGLTHSEAILAWINGEIPVSCEKQVKQKRKPTRQPDDVKRALIAGIAEHLGGVDNIENLDVTNVERVIAFTIGDDSYEITLAKKRKK